jgi:hypothetical protein
MVLLISYDLKVPGKNYTELYSTIKNNCRAWWHHLDSTWIVQTSENVNIWTERLRLVMDSNDFFIIIDITRAPRNGWLPQSAWEWIINHEVG